MPEYRELPLFRWGEELRRHRRARRTGRMKIVTAAASAAAVTALFGTLLWPPRPILVWNVTASSPIGLYHVGAQHDFAAGEMVVAWAPDAARRLGAVRHYLPMNVPLVKRVAAVAGDRVCAIGDAISINGRREAERRSMDAAGRPMPRWSGCENLRRGDLFLLTPEVPDSFDGRYFGITRANEVVGSARLLWPR
jgi:conjugative transfer signal peptidase TraF